MSDAAPAPTKKPSPRERASFRLLADGSISNRTMERHALFMADGVPGHKSWELIGKQNRGGSVYYRKNVEAHPAFKERMATLMAEKAACDADPMLGELKWMVAQMWREARATDNASMMMKAADMRLKIADKEAASAPAAPAAGAATVGQGRPGKPSAENPQARLEVEDIRQKLAARGVPLPGGAAPPKPAAAAPKTAGPAKSPDPAPRPSEPKAPETPPPPGDDVLERMLERLP